MKRFFTLIGLLSLFSAAAQVAFTGKTDISMTTPKGEKLTGKIFVAERNKGVLPIVGKVEGKHLVIHSKDFVWKAEIVKLHRLDKITGVIRNTSKRQLLLEAGLKINAPRKKGDFYWGGFDVFDDSLSPAFTQAATPNKVKDFRFL